LTSLYFAVLDTAKYLHLSLMFAGILGAYPMGWRTLKNANNCLNTDIYSYLETSGGKSYILYLNVVHFFKASVN
jgi:hypothetical protein